MTKEGACSFYSIYISYYTLMYTLSRINKHPLYGVYISQQKNNRIKSYLQETTGICLNLGNNEPYFFRKLIQVIA